MKNLILISLSLLSFNIFAQDYLYRGINNINAKIGLNTEDKEDKEEEDKTVSEDCYNPTNIGKIGTSQGCNGLLIVNTDILRDLIKGTKYTTSTNKVINSYSDTKIFTGQVTDMSFLFCNYIEGYYTNCTQKQPEVSISNWDTKNVVDMSYMFFNADNFNQNINNWDVSNVIDMYSMFGGTSNFNLPLNNWNVSNVDDMRYMFSDAISFNQPLDNWNTSNVIEMKSMFYNASNFNQDISNWCVINIKNKPYLFDSGAGFSGNTNIQPRWGRCF